MLRWREHFDVFDSQRDRTVEEGLWRRTQEKANAQQSGWQSPLDARRRILHYRYKFNVVQATGPRLAVEDVYLYYSTALPKSELAEVVDLIQESIRLGGWDESFSLTRENGLKVYVRGSLACQVKLGAVHPEDQASGRQLPPEYRFVDVRVFSGPVSGETSNLPWRVLASGMRNKDHRGRPRVVPNLNVLKSLLPFHVELGCGISLAAGIPPLHSLHRLYGVTDRAKDRFIFGAQDGGALAGILSTPEEYLTARAQMFLSIFRSQPTPAHSALRQLRAVGALVEPIYTNNFDGLAARAGVREHYIRRYDQAVPSIHLSQSARALLVVGSHADRRRVQARAREAGLQVVFCDPEEFIEKDGTPVPYPIEGAQDNDIVCPVDASVALPALASSIVGTVE